MRVRATMCAVFWAWLAACASPDESTPCARAKTMLGECGVLLPMLQGDSCTGIAEEISKCIVTTHGSCDALASLGKNLNQCITADDAGLPADFPQVRADDAGSDGAARPADDASLATDVAERDARKQS